ncbi:Detected protein of confused Function [Hibiscus syriacus]|uniref:Detected protein of confused Function n=1 Tax=Hibiscus syriacus TaxID=106335 RepID=A0A6A3A9N2_HIBSY|nr:Detected protein of confused Function [Hibiscus syriacus]
MMRALICLLTFIFIFFTIADAKRILFLPRPLPLRSFKVNATQNTGSCSYTVSIRTSCSSIAYTRDHISLAFGDAYENQVCLYIFICFIAF